jgi:hypothetical protein
MDSRLHRWEWSALSESERIYGMPFLNEKAKRASLGGNAARLFNLDPKQVKKIP